MYRQLNKSKQEQVSNQIKKHTSNKKLIKQIINKFIRNEDYKHPVFMLDWFQINDYEEDIKIDEITEVSDIGEQ